MNNNKTKKSEDTMTKVKNVLDKNKGITISQKELVKVLAKGAKVSPRTAYRAVDTLMNTGRVSKVVMLKIK